jgi:hypothetical protein
MRLLRLPAAPAALALLASAGCDLVGRPPIAEDFGAPYAVVVGALAEGLDNRATPVLTTAGRLVVVVEYTGGCSDHFFRTDYALADDRQARLWIIHDDPGDACTETVREELALPADAAVFTRAEIVLAAPNGDVRLEIVPPR